MLYFFCFFFFISSNKEFDSAKDFYTRNRKCESLKDEVNNISSENIDEGIKRLEELERKFFSNAELIEKITYEKIKLYYAKNKYSDCLAQCKVFFDYYDESSLCANVRKIVLFCYYDQIYAHDKGRNLITEAYFIAKKIIELGEEDAQVMKIYSELQTYIDYIPLEILYEDLFGSTFMWVEMLWNIQNLMESNEKCSDEAYFRLIEFFVNQKSEELYEDAEKIFLIMKKKYPNSNFLNKAENLLKIKI